MEMIEGLVVPVFKIGEVVYIKHESILEPVLCIIEKVEDNSIYLKFPDILQKKDIIPGDMIYCHKLKDDYEYVVYGEITLVEAKAPGIICVAIDKYNKYKNNRVFARYSVNLHGTFRVMGDSAEHDILLNNISIIGAAIISKEKLEKGTLLSIRVKTLIDTEVCIEFNAKLIRSLEKEYQYEYGIEITDIDPKNRDLLEKMLFVLNSNEEKHIMTLQGMNKSEG